MLDFNNRFVQYLTLSLLALIWGSSFILMKRGLVWFDSDEVAACRMAIAMVVLLPIALRHLDVLREHWGPLLIVAFVGAAAPAYLFATAQTVIPSSLSGMLNALTPLWALVLGVLFFRVRLTWFQSIGVLVALVGALGLIGFDHLIELTEYARYALLVVLAAACYGVTVNVTKSRLQGIRPAQITALTYLLAGPLLLAYVISSTDVVTKLIREPGSRAGFAYLLVLGVVCTALAVVIFNRLIKSTTAVFAASVTYVIPVVAVGWGLLDGETIAPRQLAFLALILSGILLINRPTVAR